MPVRHIKTASLFCFFFCAQFISECWVMLFVILQELTPARRKAQEDYIQRLKNEAEILKIHRKPEVEIKQMQEDMEQG